MSTLPTAQQSHRIAVVGLGGIGAVAAACLHETGCHNIVGCSRQLVDRIVLEGRSGTTAIPLRTLTNPAEAVVVDWVLLCTKSHQTPSAAPWLARLCGHRTRVAVLQNGVGHKARVARFVGTAQVLPTVVYFSGERLASDRVRLYHVGEYDLAVSDTADGSDFAALFNDTSLRVLVSSDLKTLIWRKLLINAVANPITALTAQRMSVLQRPDMAALCASILEEVVAVAQADGADLGSEEVSRALTIIRDYRPETGTSMYFDRLAGRALEFEAITGAIVAAGERFDIATPVNRALRDLLRAISASSNDLAAALVPYIAGSAGLLEGG